MSTSHEAKSNLQLLGLAWEIAGGWKALVASWTFWISIVLTVACYGSWSTAGWWNQPQGVLPALLGFTLAGFAIFLGFGSDEFKDMIASKNEGKSEYLSVSAAFLIFVFVQILALLYSLVCQSMYIPLLPMFSNYAIAIAILGKVVWSVGYFLFIFAVILTIRAALRIFRLSRWYNSFLSYKQVEDGES